LLVGKNGINSDKILSPAVGLWVFHIQFAQLFIIMVCGKYVIQPKQPILRRTSARFNRTPNVENIAVSRTMEVYLAKKDGLLG
jgi:hypothetical protein